MESFNRCVISQVKMRCFKTLSKHSQVAQKLSTTAQSTAGLSKSELCFESQEEERTVFILKRWKSWSWSRRSSKSRWNENSKFTKPWLSACCPFSQFVNCQYPQKRFPPLQASLLRNLPWRSATDEPHTPSERKLSSHHTRSQSVECLPARTVAWSIET